MLRHLGHGEGGEPGACADIHGPAVGRAAFQKVRAGQPLHRVQAVVADMHLAFGIDPGLRSEHLLGQRAAGLFTILRHGCSQSAKASLPPAHTLSVSICVKTVITIIYKPRRYLGTTLSVFHLSIFFSLNSRNYAPNPQAE